MRRSNIAEDAVRGDSADFLGFLRIARGALMELDTQVWIPIDIGLLEGDTDNGEWNNRIGAQLKALIKSPVNLERNCPLT